MVIKNHELHGFREYLGESTSIIIPASYEVENTILPVLELEDTFRKKAYIENIIIPDGVSDITSDTFLQCDGLKHIYIPSSIDYLGSAINDIENGEVLYYGGTEEQWKEATSIIWSDIHFKRVVFNATSDDCLNNKDLIIVEKQNTVSSDCVQLTNFEYDLVDAGISLTDYIGKEKSVKISESYYVNGKEYPVRKLDTTFASGSVDEVSVPEGVKTIEDATFNSCGIKKLFLPSSLTEVTEEFWDYFYELDTLYYGGTEEQFKKLLGSVDRWDLDILHVEYNSLPDDVFDN